MNILPAIDDSEPSEAAARMVIERARPGKTEVRGLTVVRPQNLLLARQMVGYDPRSKNSLRSKTWLANTHHGVLASPPVVPPLGELL
jgi:hypothetical protein